MNVTIDVQLHVVFPQLPQVLTAWQEGCTRMAASIAGLTQAITDLSADLNATLDTELTQIADALAAASGGDQQVLQDAIDLQTARLVSFRDAMKERIAQIIP